MRSVGRRASASEGDAARSPDEVLSHVLEQGEQILWSGRPDVDAMVPAVVPRRVRAFGLPVFTVIATAGALLLTRSQGIDAGQVLELLGQDGAWVFALVAVGIGPLFVFLRIAGVSTGAARHRKWARSLTFGITDRRLLVLEGDEIAWECEPDDLGAIRLRERGPTRGDLVFKEGSGGGGKETVYSRDHGRIGFKALPEPERVKELVERWRDAHRTGAERQVASFLDEPVEWPAEVEEGSPSQGRRVENPRYGFAATFPEAWEIKVRQRGAPYGKFAFEFEKWRPLEGSPDWNVIRAEGPYHTSVEIHLDVVPEPVVTLQEMMDSWMYKAFGGELLETDESVRWGRFKGFSATRRHVEHGPGQGSEDIERPAFMRSTFLHDGGLQVGVTVTWPEGSEPLEAAVDKVVREMTLTELDEYALPPVTPSGAATYLGWLVVAGRVVRVFFGLVFFASGVWSGYVQAVRLAESGGSESSTWMIPAIGGLMLMLRPLALPFEAFRGFTRAPFGKRLLMTVGLAVASVLVIGVLFP